MDNLIINSFGNRLTVDKHPLSNYGVCRIKVESWNSVETYDGEEDWDYESSVIILDEKEKLESLIKHLSERLKGL